MFLLFKLSREELGRVVSQFGVMIVVGQGIHSCPEEVASNLGVGRLVIGD
jgi:hypothetical protein